GASAAIVESQVTQVLERSLAGIEGVDLLQSWTKAESSYIKLVFRLGIDPEVAASNVRDRVGLVRRSLPPEVDEPKIEKVEVDADSMMYIVFKSDRMSRLEITDSVDRLVLDRLKN